MQTLTSEQCLSQYSETGCPKLAIVNVFGIQFFKWNHINMYKPFEMMHNILIQCYETKLYIIHSCRFGFACFLIV